jgi:hypothetical protein
MRKLTKLRIDDVSSVDKGANPGSKILFWKRDNGDAVLKHDNGEYSYLPSWALGDTHQPLLFNDAMRKAAVSDPLRGDREEDSDAKLTNKLQEFASLLVKVDPTKTEERHLFDLIHTAHGRKLAEHLNNISKKDTDPMPQIDIAKAVSILEEVLLAQAPDARTFAKKFESDIEFRKQWQTVSEAKQLLALKGMATLTPTQVGGNDAFDTSVADSSAKAVRLLNEMAAKNGSSFEIEFAKPSNSKLSAATYTHAHRSSTSGSELQGDSWARE